VRLVIASISRLATAGSERGGGRGKTTWADDAAVDYVSRLVRFAPTEEWILKPAAYRGNLDVARAEEGRRLLERLQVGDRLVVLDERGSSTDTKGWAALLERFAQQASRRVIFAIGGPYGHADEVRARADACLSLSPLVLNHQVARVLVLEQVYRVQSLLRGEPYHHE